MIKKLTCVIALLSTVGCVGEVDPAHELGKPTGAQVFSEDGQSIDPVATIHVGETTVTFFADAEGSTVFVSGPQDEVDALGTQEAFDDPVQLYESLSGEPAPASLSRAVEAERLAPAPSVDDESGEPEDDGHILQELAVPGDEAAYAKVNTDSKWVSNWCNALPMDLFEVSSCLTNVQCTGSSCTVITDRVRRAVAYVNALGSAPVRVDIDRKNTWGNYKKRASMTAEQGQVLRIFDGTDTYKHTFRVRVVNSQGAPLHLWAGLYNDHIPRAFPDGEP